MRKWNPLINRFPWRTFASGKIGYRFQDVSAEDAVNNILFNPDAVKERSTAHVFCALVNNEPGVLSKISGCLASRGFNIDSLVVSTTEARDLSRMTIRLRGPHNVMEQARRQLEDLVPVWAVLDYSNTLLIERECLLIKLSTSTEMAIKNNSDRETFESFTNSHTKRSAIREITELFQGKMLDIGKEHCVVELTAKPSRIDAFLHLVRGFGIIESSRSGLMAMSRSSVAGIRVPMKQEEEEEIEAVDISSLPPS